MSAPHYLRFTRALALVSAVGACGGSIDQECKSASGDCVDAYDGGPMGTPPIRDAQVFDGVGGGTVAYDAGFDGVVSGTVAYDAGYDGVATGLPPTTVDAGITAYDAGADDAEPESDAQAAADADSGLFSGGPLAPPDFPS